MTKSDYATMLVVSLRGNSASGLESYVRQSLMMPHSPPMFVMLDLSRKRLDVLQKYADMGALPDPLALGRAKDAVDSKLLELPEKDRPAGLQNWDEVRGGAVLISCHTLMNNIVL